MWVFRVAALYLCKSWWPWMLHHKINFLPRISSVNSMSWPREVGIVFSNLLLSISINMNLNTVKLKISYDLYCNLFKQIYIYVSRRWELKFHSQRLIIFSCRSFPISVGIVSINWLPSISYENIKHRNGC